MRVRVTIIAVGKQWLLYIMSATVAMAIQHAMPMRRITMLSAACLFLTIFSPLAYKRYDFRKKKKLLNIKRAISFSPVLSETFPILRINEILSQMYIDLPVKYPLFLSEFKETWIFSTGFRNTEKYQVSRK
jgi:hypothetical protein